MDRLTLICDASLLHKLERARAVLQGKHPAGRLEDIFAEALDVLLDQKDPERRLDKMQRLRRRPPRSAAGNESRRIPQWVKDEVWVRDGGRCAFAAPDGARCTESEGLEFDHIVPWALGGRSHDPRNIRLLCREHNQTRARRMFGGAARKA
jgi:5-methylcytosine-specific restriction endonuclease McrA